jgi:NADP-dependent 3-hydroxy acid dehydrogenase YdfG
VFVANLASIGGQDEPARKVALISGAARGIGAETSI